MLGKYDKSIEAKWQAQWEVQGTYKFDESQTSKPVYSIDTPPPFTSGDLHMGHVLSYSYFDFIARLKRMQGFNVYYPQGWDCQGFPTEVKVESKFGKGLKPEEFRKHCVEWTGNFIERMKKQMISMGFSPDWRYEYRTMSPDYHRKVQYSLIKMFEDGLVYRGEHPVFWCAHCRSAIAKAETDDHERDTMLNHLKFTCEGKDVIVATTRPELLHACVAVLVHPEDERYTALVGKDITTPLGKTVKLIADKDVDKEFGTGVVMVCTFGDKTDAVWAYRHKLQIIKAMDFAGRLLDAGAYTGLKADEAKKRIIEDLQREGKLAKQSSLRQVVKVHDRCGKPIEFLLSHQWFAKIKGLEEKIIDAGKSMSWKPEFTVQLLIDWANFIDWDWVISRQRVFGTPLPFWNCSNCNKSFAAGMDELPVVPPSMQEKKCPGCGEKLEPETSTCDCWVDSSITPLAIGKWPENPEFLSRVYPSSLRPQGTEIIRTWAFYTIYRCLMLTGKAPFKELLLNGNVLAPDGKKMSKSLGNIIPPDKLITEYSTDAVRQWAALSGALAKDRPFSYKDIAFAQSFINKYWNASAFVEKSLEGFDYSREPVSLRSNDKWILSRLNKLVKTVSSAFEEFDFHTVVSAVHDFFWHEFCDHYLETVKHRLYSPEKYGEESRHAAQYTLYCVLLASTKLLAPIACHSTESVYHEILKKHDGASSVHLSAWPKSEEAYISEEAEAVGLLLNKVMSSVRQWKAEHKMALNAPLAGVSLSLSKDDLARLDFVKEEICATGHIAAVSASEGEFALSVSA